MRGVVSDEHINVVSVENVSEHRYYGFLDHDRPGFITKTEEGMFKAVDFCQMNFGRGFVYKYNTVKEIIRQMKSEGASFFEFDTYVELLEWAIKKG